MTRSFNTPKPRTFTAPVEQFHASHNQADHGNRAGARAPANLPSDDRYAQIRARADARVSGDVKGKPKGGGQYVQGLNPSDDFGQRSLNVKQNALFSKTTRLDGPLMRPMNPLDADRQGMTADGHIVVEAYSGRGTRRYLKPTGNLVKQNRTRPGLVEFDEFEVDTVVENGTIVGKPGAATGDRRYALVEMFPQVPDYLT